MSGIVAIYHRDRAPVSASEVQGVLSALDHRGPDGRHSQRTLFAALGHQHHWTTPEESGERQPLVGPGGRYQVSFDGRLDNRRELLSLLGRRGGGSLSDARLVLLAMERWGEDCFERLLGPFAAVVFDALRHRLLCARDPMGSRTLFYHCDRRRIVVASEERAVAVHPAVDDTPDRRRLAWHMALRVPADGSTFFRDVRELLPGELLVVEESDLDRRRFRTPQPVTGLAGLSDDECGERLAELMESSVACRLRAVGPPAVLMSGGLDSTSIAGVAARRLRQTGAAPPTPISWVFDELPECDERRFIAAVSRGIGAKPELLRGDDCWPLRGLESWMANPNTPEENPYRLLKTAAYTTTAERGGRVLLTGGFGDQLWTGSAWWLADLLAAGRPAAAATELVRGLGWHRERTLGGLRRALGLPAMRRALPAGWLTAEALRLAEAPRPGSAAARARLDERLEGLLGARNARSATIETFHAASAGIELRHPFRDLRLVEFFLGLPAHQLYRRGRKKHLLRHAMRDLLPPEVLARRRPTGLGTLYNRGMREREAMTVNRLLDAGTPFAGRMIRRWWLTEARGRGRTASEELALWHLLTAELWHLRHRGVAVEELRRTA
ncbi:MAG: asparagine synthetase B family protein [Thermoanaerobaculia bacterium]